MMILTIPLFLPTMISNNINLIWFGVLVVRCVEIALITPPVGLNAFVVKGVIRDISVEDVFKGTIPFIAVDFLILILLAAFPFLSLYLPNKMGF